MINEIINLFRKKEEKVVFPREYCIVTYNQSALRNGIEDLPNKIIIRYKYNEKTERLEVYRMYGYSDSLLNNFKKKLKIPVHDQTEKPIKFPIYSEINLSEVSYLKK